VQGDGVSQAPKVLVQAVAIPPLAPSEGRTSKLLERLEGRKVLALKLEISCNFVSWRQATEGAAA
jgi:hypothetical protein